MKKRGFTLVEIIVVVIIIGIIGTIGVNLSRDRIDDIRTKNSKEAFVAIHQQLLSSTLASNYYQNHSYEYVDRILSGGTNHTLIQYALTPSGSNNNDIHYLRKQYSLNHLSINAVSNYSGGTFRLTPLTFGCEFIPHTDNTTQREIDPATQSGRDIQFYSQTNQEICYQLTSSNCTIREKKCHK